MSLTTQARDYIFLSDQPVLIAVILFILAGNGIPVAIRTIHQELAPSWAGASRFFLTAMFLRGLAGVVSGSKLCVRQENHCSYQQQGKANEEIISPRNSCNLPARIDLFHLWE